MNIKQKVGLRIKELRKEKNLSQEKLALKAEIDRTHMHSIEAGKTNVSIEILEKLSNALDINIIEFFKND